MPRSRFPQAARVKRSDDFSDILQSGAFWADEVLVVNLRRSADGGTRIGITIPKKTGTRWFVIAGSVGYAKRFDCTNPSFPTVLS